MATADVSYVPGALTAVTGDQCWALVETSPDSPAVTRIWRRLGQGVAADVLLAGLLADGIGGTPGFALLVAGPGRQRRLFCRGTVGATVVSGTADGGAPPGAGQAVTERIDGAGLLTWREQVVERAERIFLGGPPAETSVRLPATSGVLLAGCVVIDLTPHQPPAPRAESGPGEPGSAVKRGELPERVARTTPPDRIGPVVPALLCPSRHVNPPSGAVCRRCGAPLPHDPVPVPRPVLGVLRLSLGDVIMLDRGVLMGRNPRTDFGGTEGGERPHVVKLPSADGDISRTHLRVTLDGWQVLVTDLNSTNGTLVTLPGRDPQQLRPGEPVPIQPGTVVTLADGIDFRYEAAD
jgi:FHA domain